MNDPDRHACELRHGAPNIKSFSQRIAAKAMTVGKMSHAAERKSRAATYISASGITRSAKGGFIIIPSAMNVPASKGLFPRSAKL